MTEATSFVLERMSVAAQRPSSVLPASWILNQTASEEVGV